MRFQFDAVGGGYFSDAAVLTVHCEQSLFHPIHRRRNDAEIGGLAFGRIDGRIAMLGRHDHECRVREALRLQFRKHASDRSIGVIECFEEIGGYTPSRNGGIDWIAVTKARMIGWKTRSFREKSFFHHRVLGTADRGLLGSSYVYGKKDYYLGGSPVWQLFWVVYRMGKRPMIIGGLALLSGYFWAALGRIKKPVSRELMRFHRREQMKKLRVIMRAVSRGQRVNSFSLAPEQERPGRC